MTEAEIRIDEIEKRVAEIRKGRIRERANNALEPCPFCGGKAEIRNRSRSDGRESYQIVCVECVVCGAKTVERISDGYFGLRCSDEEIAAIWNRRVGVDDKED